MKEIFDDDEYETIIECGNCGAQQDAHNKFCEKCGVIFINNIKDDGDELDDDDFIDIVCPLCGEEISFSKDEINESNTLTCPLCEGKFDSDNI